MARIDDTDLVRHEYADATNLATRFRPLREYQLGQSIDYEIVLTLHRAMAQRVLELGSGEGRLSKLLQYWLGTGVTAVDQSQHMVDLARGFGIDAHVADAQQVPFRDGEFDAVVANFMLYHLPDLDRGLREIRRVLRPGGILVATTMGDMLPEVWNQVANDGSTPVLGFAPHNGARLLLPMFDRVSERRLRGTAVFPDRDAVLDYMRATITRAHLADQLPHFEGPLHATTDVSLFVAERGASAQAAA